VALADRHGPSTSCRELALPKLRGADPRVWLIAALERIPCPATGRVSYGTLDNHGDVLGSLDPIDDPAGGYLGVYDYGVRAPAGPTRSTFQIALGRSADLIHWTRLDVLDPQGASMPSLRAIPGQPGYLLAYEKHLPGRLAHSLRVRYYASRAALLANRAGSQIDLPLRFSRYSNGTPAFVGIDWNGSLARSTIAISFHYLGPGKIDREAFGVLRGFRGWRAVPAAPIDQALDDLGFAGNHGDRRLFTFAGRPWFVYEAQMRPRDYATWRVLLYDDVAKTFHALTFATETERRAATSFGNPIVNTLRGPGGHGNVLAVTIFAFSRPRSVPVPGELVYYQPLTGG
jgi:hypothetical protein